MNKLFRGEIGRPIPRNIQPRQTCLEQRSRRRLERPVCARLDIQAAIDVAVDAREQRKHVQAGRDHAALGLDADLDVRVQLRFDVDVDGRAEGDGDEIVRGALDGLAHERRGAGDVDGRERRAEGLVEALDRSGLW